MIRLTIARLVFSAKFASLLALLLIFATVVSPGTTLAATADPTYGCGNYGGADYDSCDSATGGTTANNSSSSSSTTSSSSSGTSTSKTDSPTSTTNTQAASKNSRESVINTAKYSNHRLLFGSLAILLLGLALFLLLLIKRHKRQQN